MGLSAIMENLFWVQKNRDLNHQKLLKYLLIRGKLRLMQLRVLINVLGINKRVV